ncbi:hypothetical protein [Mycolicibacterium pallens]|uniref:Secreted protein n=1 Tax=Mycolicibacterium pallens TaxID=370524 RepID=A0ABX8VJT1_9MYCO|nr:hypothetical protein [Mycolicibacterium pallens]QYL15769.1 hypothetical protein K0O64_22255 [Mycolicibacterium pallens]
MSNIKTLSAVVGGSAIVAMGALAVAVSEQGSGMIVSDPGTFTSPVTSSMTTGETSKSSSVEETVSPASAAPPVTATTPEAP